MRQLLLVSLMLLVAAVCSTAAWAGALVQVSGASLFASCTADDVPGQPGTNNYQVNALPTISSSVATVNFSNSDGTGAYIYTGGDPMIPMDLVFNAAIGSVRAMLDGGEEA